MTVLYRRNELASIVLSKDNTYVTIFILKSPLTKTLNPEILAQHN